MPPKRKSRLGATIISIHALVSLATTIPMATQWMKTRTFITQLPYHFLINAPLAWLGYGPLFDEESVKIIEYPEEAECQGINFAFGLHMVTGFAFLVVFLMVSRTIGYWRLHRYAGYAAIPFFLFHMAAASNNLYFDAVKHSRMEKSVYFVNIVYILIYFYYAVSAARRGSYRKHGDLMLKAYLQAAEGSGTIRVISFSQHVISQFIPDSISSFLFPGSCQQKHKAMVAVDCRLAYALRFLLIRLFTFLIYYAYLKLDNLPRGKCLKFCRHGIWLMAMQFSTAMVLLQVANIWRMEGTFDAIAAAFILMSCPLAVYDMTSTELREEKCND